MRTSAGCASRRGVSGWLHRWPESGPGRTCWPAMSRPAALRRHRLHLHWWEVFGTLRWAVVCRLQARRFEWGLESGIDFAVLGRKVCEQEFDVLAAIDFPGRKAPSEDAVHRAGTAADVQDWPSAAVLIAAVRRTYRDAAAGTTGHAAYLAKVAANALGIVERELTIGAAHGDEHRRSLAALGCRFRTPTGAGDPERFDRRRERRTGPSCLVDGPQPAAGGEPGVRPGRGAGAGAGVLTVDRSGRHRQIRAMVSNSSWTAAAECPETNASTCGSAAAIPPVSGAKPGAALRGLTQITRCASRDSRSICSAEQRRVGAFPAVGHDDDHRTPRQSPPAVGVQEGLDRGADPGTARGVRRQRQGPGDRRFAPPAAERFGHRMQLGGEHVGMGARPQDGRVQHPQVDPRVRLHGTRDVGQQHDLPRRRAATSATQPDRVTAGPMARRAGSGADRWTGRTGGTAPSATAGRAPPPSSCR